MDQILLYRDTRESILAGVDEKAWRHMLPAAREKALQAEMKAESNLHPALYPPSEDGSGVLASTPSGSLYVDASSPSATARQHCMRSFFPQALPAAARLA